ncbi:alpha-1,2-fucosyltransferase [Chitinophaga sp. CF118]|uniref:alpha-1,2-fucosyltransferase n=1 Tax=Chitinophaga sp. CF118 TaxID=1884367 RepID=UPI0015A54D85|nr:alpha-1,2-fucosyltransferase [Chitinophaga sp. CF118]
MSELESGRLTTSRNYELHHFNVVQDFVEASELKAVKLDLHGHIMNKLLIGIQEKVWRIKSSHFMENGNVDSLLAGNSRPVYLDGYWQSEKYFKQYGDVIRREFTAKDEWDGHNKQILNSILNADAVSIHIRRGDYVTNAVTNKFHGTCDIDYYQKAIALVEERMEAPFYYIFSDDLPWAKEHLVFSKGTAHFVDNNADAAFMDIMLMSKCKYNIIANSTFSWWGAWLNNNPGKLVIAPKKWFNHKDDSDIIPDTWMKI